MKLLLILLSINNLFADFDFEFSSYDLFFVIPIIFIFLLLFNILKLTIKNKSKKIDFFQLDDDEYNPNMDYNFVKTLHEFDLQEVFLYFFKTLNYEASARNNIFLVRQQFISKEGENTVFVPRKLYGDYTSIINAVAALARFFNQNLDKKTIFININIKGLSQGKASFIADVGTCEDNTDFFNKIRIGNDGKINQDLNNFVQVINDIDGAFYTIKSEEKDKVISLSIPITVMGNNTFGLFNDEQLNLLIIHQNNAIVDDLTNIFDFFNIKCFSSNSSDGLINKIEDGVNCIYRALLIDYDIFISLEDAIIERLINAQSKFKIKLVVILNNNKKISKIEKYFDKIDFLLVPYTIDNIRIIAKEMKIQQEKITA